MAVRTIKTVSAGQDNTVHIWDPYDMTCLKAFRRMC